MATAATRPPSTTICREEFLALHARAVRDGSFSPLDLLDVLPAYQPQSDWRAVRAFLAAAFGLPMSEAELALYQACTGRREAPTQQADEAWMCVGRRGSKGRTAALGATYLGCYRDYSPYLAAGQWGQLPVVAASRRQAGEVMDYLKGMFAVPPLSYLVEDQTGGQIRLVTRVVIDVGTASYRTIRAPTVVGAVLDELAFWRTEDGSRNPDAEILRALRPSMATIPGAMLWGLSSPYAQRGVLWDTYSKHFGKERDRILVWQAATDVMHAAPPGSKLRAEIDRAYEDDPVSARAEYGAQFREDVQAYVSPQVVDAAVDVGVTERPRDPASLRNYFGFADPSGGGADSFAVGVAHHEKDGLVVVDFVRQWAISPDPEKDTMAATANCSMALKAYGIKMVVGDHYAGQWPTDAFRRNGITYVVSDRTKRTIYLDAVALLNGHRIRLVDNKVLIAQIKSLDRIPRQGGQDLVDHPPGAHDDLANAALGAALQASTLGGHRQPPEAKQAPATTTWEIQARRRDAALARDHERAMGKQFSGPAGRTRYYRRPRW